MSISTSENRRIVEGAFCAVEAVNHLKIRENKPDDNHTRGSRKTISNFDPAEAFKVIEWLTLRIKELQKQHKKEGK